MGESATALGPRLRRRTDAPVRAELSRRGFGLALVLGYVGHVLVRLWLAAGRDGPLVFADETGYLLHARVIAGGVPGDLSQAMFYRGGYSLLVSPAFLLSHNPVRQYHLILGFNALLLSLTFPLLVALLVRVFGVPRGRACLVAVVVAAAPALLLDGMLAWPEAVIIPAFLGVLLALDVWLRRSTVTAAAVLGVLAGALPIIHGRLLPVTGLVVLAVVVICLLRPEYRRSALVVIVAAAVIYLLGSRLDGYLADRNYGGSPSGGSDRILDNLRDAGVLRNVVGMGFGQFWYLMAASGSMVALGLVALVERLRGRPDLRRQDPAELSVTVISAVQLLALVGVALIAAVFLYPPSRADIVVYGRYVEVLAPLAFALGLDRVWGATSRRRLLVETIAASVLLVVAGAVISVYADHLLSKKLSNFFNILAVPGLSNSSQYVQPVQVTLVVLVTAAVLLLLSRRGQALAALLLVVLSLVSADWTRDHAFSRATRSAYGQQLDDQVELPGLRHGEAVDYDMAGYTIEGLWLFQWMQPDAHFELFNSLKGQRPTTRLVIASKSWTQAGALGAHLVWSDSARDQAVWELPTG